METQRVIFTCKNKECGYTYAYDYQVKRERRSWGDAITFYRQTETALVLDSQDRARCPKCNSRLIKPAYVKGIYNPTTTCDGRCMSAHGEICSCSCEGKNHGSNYIHH